MKLCCFHGNLSFFGLNFFLSCINILKFELLHRVVILLHYVILEMQACVLAAPHAHGSERKITQNETFLMKCIAQLTDNHINQEPNMFFLTCKHICFQEAWWSHTGHCLKHVFTPDLNVLFITLSKAISMWVYGIQAKKENFTVAHEWNFKMIIDLVGDIYFQYAH